MRTSTVMTSPVDLTGFAPGVGTAIFDRLTAAIAKPIDFPFFELIHRVAFLNELRRTQPKSAFIRCHIAQQADSMTSGVA